MHYGEPPTGRQVYSRNFRDASKQTCSTTVSVLYWASPRILNCSVLENGADRLSQNFGKKKNLPMCTARTSQKSRGTFIFFLMRATYPANLTYYPSKIKFISLCSQFSRQPHIRGNVQGRPFFFLFRVSSE